MTWPTYVLMLMIWPALNKKQKRNHSTQDSHVVPHHGTNWAALWLTTQIRRDAVLSESYGRGCSYRIKPHFWRAFCFRHPKEGPFFLQVSHCANPRFLPAHCLFLGSAEWEIWKAFRIGGVIKNKGTRVETANVAYGFIISKRPALK
jgi:hypothetical protein